MPYKEKSAVLFLDLIDQVKDSLTLLDSAMCLRESLEYSPEEKLSKMDYLISLCKTDILQKIEIFEDDFEDIKPTLTY